MTGEIDFALEYADQARSEATLEFATVSLPRGKYDTIRAHIIELAAQRNELAQALRGYMRTFPAFRTRPEGMEGSLARIRQDEHIAVEDIARAALAKVQP